MTVFKTISYLLKPITDREFWVFMGQNDIRYKYKRSLLGPFWLTLTNAVYIGMLAFIFSALFRTDDPMYVPWVACGVVLWNFITTIITESSIVYYNKKGFLLQNDHFTAPQLIYWTIWRNILVLLHQLPIIIVVLFIFHQLPTPMSLLWLLMGVSLFFIILLPLALIFALLTTRLRDLEPLVTVGFTALFFLTPVMWLPDMLGDKAWIAHFNPFAYLLELIRNPMLGLPLSVWTLQVSAGFAVVNWLVAILLYKRFTSRLVYWV